MSETILAELYTDTEESFRVKHISKEVESGDIKLRLERYVRGEWTEFDTWSEPKSQRSLDIDTIDSIIEDARRRLLNKPHLDASEITGDERRYR
jgi:hypothetical protein